MLAVIAYHDNYSWARGGFLGVDAFFVLSGFLITMLLVLEFRRDDRVRLGAFWGRRARRLLPALFIVLLFVSWYTHHYVAPWERAGIRDDGIASLFYAANWRFIVDKQSYFTLFSAASPLRHMWSLAIEEQFYLVWPLVVLACLRLARGRLRILAGVCVVGALVSAALMAALYRSGDPSRAYYGTDTRAHGILIGALLALAFIVRPPSDWVRRALVIVGPVAFLAVLVSWHGVSDTGASYYQGGSAVFAVVVAIVIAAALAGGPIRRLLSAPGLPWIGRLSYGLYLWHWPIVVWIVPTRVHVGTTALNLIRLALTFGFAITSYYLVERPIRERWGPMKHRRLVWLAPIALGVTAMALMGANAGAAPPPSYIWGYGDPFRCGPPRPQDAAAARAQDRARGPLRLPASMRSERILLVGDSTACSLWTGLRAVGRAHGIRVWQGSVFGCGIASGQITTTRNEQITPHSERCPQMVDSALGGALARARPTLILWMSIWEKSDIVQDGRVLVNGTAAGDRVMFSRMDDVLRRLDRGGARVALLTVAPPAPNDAQGTSNTSNAVDDASYVQAPVHRQAVRGATSRPHLRRRSRSQGVPLGRTVRGVPRRPTRATGRPPLRSGCGRRLRQMGVASDRTPQGMTKSTVAGGKPGDPPGPAQATPDRRRRPWPSAGPGTVRPGPPVTRPIALLVAIGLVVLPLVVAAVVVLVRPGETPFMDNALMEMRVRDVGQHPVLLGLYSRDGWSHPGPLVFYTLALPYRLLGSSTAGMQVGALIVNGVAVAGSILVARRLGGIRIALAVALCASLLVRALGPNVVGDPWVCFVTTLPFVLFLVLVWALFERRAWALPTAALVASWLAQTHVGFTPITVALGGVGTLVLVGRGVRHADARRRLRRAVATTIGVLAVVWLPPVYDQLGSRGNLGAIVDWFGAPAATTHTIAEGARSVLGVLGVVPDWITGHRRVAPFNGETLLRTQLVLPLLLIPFAAAVFYARRRRNAPLLRFGLVLAAALAVSIVAVANTIGVMYEYRLLWVWSLAALVGAVTLAIGWTLGAARFRSLDRFVLPILLASLVALSVTQIVEISDRGHASVGRSGGASGRRRAGASIRARRRADPAAQSQLRQRVVSAGAAPRAREARRRRPGARRRRRPLQRVPHDRERQTASGPDRARDRRLRSPRRTAGPGPRRVRRPAIPRDDGAPDRGDIEQ